jgi:tetratricopeptide (TPR) repeat protein
LRELVLATAEGRSDAPVASLWFYAGKLVAIRLQQHRDATRLDFDDVLAMLETEPEKQQSFTHGAGMQFDDRSMRVRYHFVAGRSLLVFSDRDAMRALDEVVQRREQALVKVSEGERQLQNRRLDAARSSFREAAQTAPSLGLPWLRLCEVSAQKEDFDAVQQAALEAEKISEDARVKAEAHAFIAMFRLWQGDVAQALDAWETASRLHPGAPRYSEAIDELRSGAFSAERVALTVARMSCMKQRGSTERGVLIRGNFKDTETYFAALRQVRTAEDFTQLEARFRKSECGP